MNVQSVNNINKMQLNSRVYSNYSMMRGHVNKMNNSRRKDQSYSGNSQTYYKEDYSFSNLREMILDEILVHVNSTGLIPSPLETIENNGINNGVIGSYNEKDVYNMKLPSEISDIFIRICEENIINRDLDEKDRFLATSGLMRPGINSVLRKRREIAVKKLSRNLVGRLRPNPRPRYFDDHMVAREFFRCSDIISDVSKTSYRNRLSAAQITAAQKLTSAKNRHKRNISTIRKSRPKIFKSNPHYVSLRRSTRTGNMNANIDWKFCYSREALKSVKRAKQMNKTYISNDDYLISDEDVYNTDEDVKQNNKTLINSLQNDSYECLPTVSSHKNIYDNEKPHNSPILSDFLQSKCILTNKNNAVPRKQSRINSRKLTLLDRLILGLHCTVSHDNDIIQIRQLHQADLNILTQRTYQTGFMIQSLSLKPNPCTKEAEYNVVLSYNSGAIKDNFSSSSRELFELLKGEASKSRKLVLQLHHNTTNALQKSKSLENISDLKAPSINIMRHYHSDSNLCSARQDSVRRLIQNLETKCGENTAIKIMKKLRRISAQRNKSNVVADESSIDSDYELEKIPWKPRNKFKKNEDDEGYTEVGEVKMELPKFIPNSSDFDFPSANDLSNITQNISVNSLHQIGFKRHSPRKVVRKVYTGGSNLPKILNRKKATIQDSSLQTDNQKLIIIPNVNSSPSINSLDAESDEHIYNNIFSEIEISNEEIAVDDDHGEIKIESVYSTKSSDTEQKVHSKVNRESYNFGIISHSDDVPARALSASQLLKLKQNISTDQKFFFETHQNLNNISDETSEGLNPVPKMYTNSDLDISCTLSADSECNNWPSGTSHTTVGLNKTKVILSSVSNTQPPPKKFRPNELKYNSIQTKTFPYHPQETSSNETYSKLHSTNINSVSHSQILRKIRPISIPSNDTCFKRAPLSLYHAGGTALTPSLSNHVWNSYDTDQIASIPVKPNKILVHKYHSFKRVISKNSQEKLLSTSNDIGLINSSSTGSSHVLKTLLEHHKATNIFPLAISNGSNRLIPANSISHNRGRGTWQLGKRTTVLNATLKNADSTHRLNSVNDFKHL